MDLQVQTDAVQGSAVEFFAFQPVCEENEKSTDIMRIDLPIKYLIRDFTSKSNFTYSLTIKRHCNKNGETVTTQFYKDIQRYIKGI